MDNFAYLLEGKRVLLVEDEIVVAMNLRRELVLHGAEPLGPVIDVAEVMEAVGKTTVDAALINISFDADAAFRITERLDSHSIPYLFVASVCPYGVPEHLCKYLLGKENSMHIIARALFGPNLH